MTAPVCTCPEDPEKRSATYTHQLGREAHAAGCPRWGMPELSIDPAEVEDHPGRRWRGCVEKWPDCASMEFNPSCCRFPKSCSATVVLDQYTREEDLEPVTHHRDQCKHGVLVSQCRCASKDKQIRIVACPDRCPGVGPLASYEQCGVQHPGLAEGNVCREPKGHEGFHMAHDSMGRPEYGWRQELPRAEDGGTYAHRCRSATCSAAPRWTLVRRGDVVTSWACDRHLSDAVDDLQRNGERTEVVITRYTGEPPVVEPAFAPRRGRGI